MSAHSESKKERTKRRGLGRLMEQLERREEWVKNKRTTGQRTKEAGSGGERPS